MRSFVKSSLRGLVLKNHDPREYFPVRIPYGTIAEKVMLLNGQDKVDITDRHSIVCQTPFCIAIWMPSGRLAAGEGGRYTVQITKDGKVSATVKIALVRIIEEDTRIMIGRVEKVRCYNPGRLRQFILIKYFFPKGKKTFREGMIYGALYSYPRSIITVSYKEAGYYNIFPMDFQGCFAEGKIHIFGLRITNITLEKILRTKRIVIGDTGGSDIRTIYGLGSHHSSHPPVIERLPFSVIESEQFRFPVPAFTGAYKEIEIVSSYRLGSHMMLVGKVINEKRLKEQVPPLYHIHFFQFIQSCYTTV